VIEQIKLSIDWYNKNYSKAIITQLIDLKSKLVTDNYYLAELLAENNSYCLQAENAKKVYYAKIKHSLLLDGWQIGKAEAKAENDISEQRELYSNYKAVTDRLKLLHNQVNEVCNDIQQRISILKLEQQTKI
jgi:hypothetical protein